MPVWPAQNLGPVFKPKAINRHGPQTHRVMITKLHELITYEELQALLAAYGCTQIVLPLGPSMRPRKNRGHALVTLASAAQQCQVVDELNGILLGGQHIVVAVYGEEEVKKKKKKKPTALPLPPLPPVVRCGTETGAGRKLGSSDVDWERWRLQLIEGFLDIYDEESLRVLRE
ncbi:hypothetical protein EDC01DRAFT_143710 [Geopyxis carbonaria]|nr:hypothetical protein EDC01DRAFT_143710 [Geopyxis carbonaria]